LFSCGLYFWKELDYTGGLFAVYSIISISDISNGEG
jgi:hypothetical protein